MLTQSHVISHAVEVDGKYKILTATIEANGLE